MGLVDDVAAHAADALDDIDCGKMSTTGQRAIQPEMSVCDALHRIGNRLVEIVGFDEHGVKAGDRAGRGISRALEYFRNHCKHAWRKALGCGRFARRQADLPLRLRHACERIQQQQDAVVLIAEILGDRACHSRCAHAQQRRVVRRCDDHNASLQSFFAKMYLHKFQHFAGALSDQRDDGNIRISELGDA